MQHRGNHPSNAMMGDPLLGPALRSISTALNPDENSQHHHPHHHHHDQHHSGSHHSHHPSSQHSHHSSNTHGGGGVSMVRQTSAPSHPGAATHPTTIRGDDLIVGGVRSSSLDIHHPSNQILHHHLQPPPSSRQPRHTGPTISPPLPTVVALGGGGGGGANIPTIMAFPTSSPAYVSTSDQPTSPTSLRRSTSASATVIRSGPEQSARGRSRTHFPGGTGSHHTPTSPPSTPASTPSAGTSSPRGGRSPSSRIRPSASTTHLTLAASPTFGSITFPASPPPSAPEPGMTSQTSTRSAPATSTPNPRSLSQQRSQTGLTSSSSASSAASASSNASASGGPKNARGKGKAGRKPKTARSWSRARRTVVATDGVGGSPASSSKVSPPLHIDLSDSMVDRVSMDAFDSTPFLDRRSPRKSPRKMSTSGAPSSTGFGDWPFPPVSASMAPQQAPQPQPPASYATHPLTDTLVSISSTSSQRSNASSTASRAGSNHSALSTASSTVHSSAATAGLPTIAGLGIGTPGTAVPPGSVRPTPSTASLSSFTTAQPSSFTSSSPATTHLTDTMRSTASSASLASSTFALAPPFAPPPHPPPPGPVSIITPAAVPPPTTAGKQQPRKRRQAPQPPPTQPSSDPAAAATAAVAPQRKRMSFLSLAQHPWPKLAKRMLSFGHGAAPGATGAGGKRASTSTSSTSAPAPAAADAGQASSAMLRRAGVPTSVVAGAELGVAPQVMGHEEAAGAGGVARRRTLSGQSAVAAVGARGSGVPVVLAAAGVGGENGDRDGHAGGGLNVPAAIELARSTVGTKAGAPKGSASMEAKKLLNRRAATGSTNTGAEEESTAGDDGLSPSYDPSTTPPASSPRPLSATSSELLGGTALDALEGRRVFRTRSSSVRTALAALDRSDAVSLASFRTGPPARPRTRTSTISGIGGGVGAQVVVGRRRRRRLEIPSMSSVLEMLAGSGEEAAWAAGLATASTVSSAASSVVGVGAAGDSGDAGSFVSARSSLSGGEASLDVGVDVVVLPPAVPAPRPRSILLDQHIAALGGFIHELYSEFTEEGPLPSAGTAGPSGEGKKKTGAGRRRAGSERKGEEEEGGEGRRDEDGAEKDGEGSTGRARKRRRSAAAGDGWVEGQEKSNDRGEATDMDGVSSTHGKTGPDEMEHDTDAHDPAETDNLEYEGAEDGGGGDSEAEEEAREAEAEVDYLSSIFPNWTVGRLLGTGATGMVFEAVHSETLEPLFAIKKTRVVNTHPWLPMPKLFSTIVKVLRLADHPNVLKYYGVEQVGEDMYVFMEYCGGGSIRDRIYSPHLFAKKEKENGLVGGDAPGAGGAGGTEAAVSGPPVPGIRDEKLIRRWMRMILEGLRYIHKHDIVHRDLKPGNLLILDSGLVKIADFGGSKIQQRCCDQPHLTQMFGSPSYMAPEIITSSAEGPKGAQDIWSLGCCLFEMVLGKPPWYQLDNVYALYYLMGTYAKRAESLQTEGAPGSAGIGASAGGLAGGAVSAAGTEAYRRGGCERHAAVYAEVAARMEQGSGHPRWGVHEGPGVWGRPRAPSRAARRKGKKADRLTEPDSGSVKTYVGGDGVGAVLFNGSATGRRQGDTDADDDERFGGLDERIRDSDLTDSDFSDESWSPDEAQPQLDVRNGGSEYGQEGDATTELSASSSVVSNKTERPGTVSDAGGAVPRTRAERGSVATRSSLSTRSSDSSSNVSGSRSQTPTGGAGSSSVSGSIAGGGGRRPSSAVVSSKSRSTSYRSLTALYEEDDMGVQADGEDDKDPDAAERRRRPSAQSGLWSRRSLAASSPTYGGFWDREAAVNGDDVGKMILEELERGDRGFYDEDGIQNTAAIEAAFMESLGIEWDPIGAAAMAAGGGSAELDLYKNYTSYGSKAAGRRSKIPGLAVVHRENRGMGADEEDGESLADPAPVDNDPEMSRFYLSRALSLSSLWAKLMGQPSPTAAPIESGGAAGAEPTEFPWNSDPVPPKEGETDGLIVGDVTAVAALTPPPDAGTDTEVDEYLTATDRDSSPASQLLDDDDADRDEIGRATDVFDRDHIVASLDFGDGSILATNAKNHQGLFSPPPSIESSPSASQMKAGASPFALTSALTSASLELEDLGVKDAQPPTPTDHTDDDDAVAKPEGGRRRGSTVRERSRPSIGDLNGNGTTAGDVLTVDVPMSVEASVTLADGSLPSPEVPNVPANVKEDDATSAASTLQVPTVEARPRNTSNVSQGRPSLSSESQSVGASGVDATSPTVEGAFPSASTMYNANYHQNHHYHHHHRQRNPHHHNRFKRPSLAVPQALPRPLATPVSASPGKGGRQRESVGHGFGPHEGRGARKGYTREEILASAGTANCLLSPQDCLMRSKALNNPLMTIALESGAFSYEGLDFL
ncbi:Suppressor of Sensor Kinase (SLN1) [Phlyctochytrium bullatum]|nr:Suppressor of Sensor Kinase (SLN1) [Phlyctochytrium bullatum]